MNKFFIIVVCKIYGLVQEEFRAMGILTLFHSLNVLTLVGYYKITILHSDHITMPTIYEIIIIVLIGTLNYFLLLNKGRFVAIYKNFKEMSSFSGRRGTILTLSYVGFSIVFFISLVWVARGVFEHSAAVDVLHQQDMLSDNL